MRTLRLVCVASIILPGMLACSSRNGPEGDIGYGASDGLGNIGNESNNGGTGNQSGGSGGKSNGGSGNVSNEGGAPEIPPEGSCGEFWTATAPESDCDLDGLEDSGITIGVDKGLYRSVEANTTLESGKTYKLSGPTYIEAGVTLTVGKCTKIFGQSPESVIVTESGLKKTGLTEHEPSGTPGKLVAVGEPNAPIIFTSAKAPGERLRGDWGGIILTGRAPDNWYNLHTPERDGLGPFQVEGLDSRKIITGWKDATYADESSGHLEFVRIEFVGRSVNKDNETNGLTFNSVGSGTKISHVMVANSIDDCFEWFGGRVSADHLIAFNCDDDGFDTDLGYQGHVQFAFTRQLPATNETDSNGFEWDGQSKDKPKIPDPPSLPHFSNVTACGGNTGKFLANPRFGMVFRTAASGTLVNTLFTGFDTAAVALRYNDEDARVTTTLTYSTLWNNFALYDSAETMTPAMWIESQEGNNTQAPTGMCDCWADPPQPYAIEKIQGAAPGDGYLDPDADYRGAFKDGTPDSNWMSGSWVDWSDK
jgi:hypothetical protein